MIRTIVISGSEAGQTVAAVLQAHLALSPSQARAWVRRRQVRLDNRPCLDPAWRVRRGQRVQVHVDKPAKPSGSQRVSQLAPAAIRHADAHVVVVDKPAGLTTMRHPEEAAEFGARGRRFLPPTLADLLPGLLSRRGRVRAVHRLDKDTSGLVVFALTAEAERHLGRQFRAHTVERRYLAVVRGRAKAGRIESYLVRDRGDGRRGSAREPGAGQRAVTHVRIVEELGDYTLVECRLETGRTHQVRIHLAEAGTPLCGERVYDRPLHGKPLPDGSGAPRVALHAAVLGFEHPATGKRMRWTSSLPKDLAELIEQLR
jgi:23S rRNA pseudouridine1911/1915/1917 synthase